MARTVRDTNLETRTARLRLAARGKPYWRVLETGLHVGYRRTTRGGGGTWTARRFTGERSYAETRLGIADDLQDANGHSILDFRQAQAAARIWWESETRKDHGLAPSSCSHLVAAACESYITDYEARGGKALGALKSVVATHIIPALGSTETAKLTTKRLRDWHRAIAKAPKFVRTSKFAKARNMHAIDAADADAVRSRRATANRVLNVLKAVLNHAFRERTILSDEAWRPVSPFKNVEAPIIRYLTADECRRLVNACQPDMRRIVQAALLTGCRYGELSRLTCGDINLDTGTLTVREAKGGHRRHVVLTGEASEFFETITAGRKPNERLLTRHDGGPWKASQQARPLADACKRASIEPEIVFHILRHTHASLLAMKGVPMGVVASQLGHSSTVVTEKHYAHLAPSYVAETIRAAFPNLGIAGRTGAKIARLRRRHG